MSAGSWIPDGVSATLGDLVDLYGQVETAKLNNRLARAKASQAAFAAPSQTSQPQAKDTTAKTPGGGVNPWLVGAGVLAAALLIYVAVK